MTFTSSTPLYTPHTAPCPHYCVCMNSSKCICRYPDPWQMISISFLFSSIGNVALLITAVRNSHCCHFPRRRYLKKHDFVAVALFLISDIMMEMIERRSRGQIRYQISFCIAPAAKHIISTMRDETWLRQEMLRTSRSGEKHGNCSNGKTLTRGFLQEILMSFLVLFEISNNSTLYKCTMLIDLHNACMYQEILP